MTEILTINVVALLKLIKFLPQSGSSLVPLALPRRFSL